MTALAERFYANYGLARFLVLIRVATVAVLATFLAASTIVISALERRGALTEAEDIALTLLSFVVAATLAVVIGRRVIAPIAEANEGQLRTALDEERSTRRALEAELGIRQDFIDQANHHLRTPVTVVYGMAQLLRQHGDDLEPETRDSMRATILDNAGKLKDIVEDLSVFLDDRVQEVAAGRDGIESPSEL